MGPDRPRCYRRLVLVTRTTVSAAVMGSCGFLRSSQLDKEHWSQGAVHAGPLFLAAASLRPRRCAVRGGLRAPGPRRPRAHGGHQPDVRAAEPAPDEGARWRRGPSAGPPLLRRGARGRPEVHRRACAVPTSRPEAGRGTPAGLVTATMTQIGPSTQMVVRGLSAAGDAGAAPPCRLRKRDPDLDGPGA